MSNYKISGVIISAGLSGRMNQFKPLALYKGKSFLNNIIIKLSSLCNNVFIVTGHDSEKLQQEINKELGAKYNNLRFVHNKYYQRGMFTSLQKGFEAAKDCDWIIYHFVDQPGLPEQFYTEFISQVDEKHNWVQPTVNERKGHPILLHKELFDLIISSKEDSNLREVGSNNLFRKKYWECGYSEIFQDIDTEEDYIKLKSSL
jgi:molybdenum cofactor cytidylyltransferase